VKARLGTGGRWGLLFNAQWSVLEQNDNSIEGTPLQADLKMNMGLFEFAGAYSFGQHPFRGSGGGPTWAVGPLVGVRVTVMQIELDFDTAVKAQERRTWVDPFLGARLQLRPSAESRWSWTMRGDIGGFGAGSEFTWNASA